MKILFVAMGLLLSISSYANFNKSICGGADDRFPSNDQRIGRILGSMDDNGGCTATLIGRSCAITAGHCKDILTYVEFNVPNSTADGNIIHPGSEDIYEIDQTSIVSKYEPSGKDFAVFRIKPHGESKKYAGDVYGSYKISFSKPGKGTKIRIRGFGVDYNNPEYNCIQQEHVAEIKGYAFFKPWMYHSIDTTGGASGSAIINESTGNIIGIHTNAGCYNSGGKNRSMIIKKIPELRTAIESCLRSEQ